jgi:hypothetical protein
MKQNHNCLQCCSIGDIENGTSSSKTKNTVHLFVPLFLLRHRLIYGLRSPARPN